MFGRNWRTTLAGLLGGVATAILPVIQGGQTDSKSLIGGAVIGLLGFLAGDGKRV